MKTMTRILGVTAVLAVIALAVPTADAACIPAAQFSSWGAGGFFYVNMPPGATNSTVVGKFWRAGDFAGANNGAYDDSLWLRFCSEAAGCPGGKWYISGSTGDIPGTVCPNGGNMILTLENLADGRTLTLESVETPIEAVRWDFSEIRPNTFFSRA